MSHKNNTLCLQFRASEFSKSVFCHVMGLLKKAKKTRLPNEGWKLVLFPTPRRNCSGNWSFFRKLKHSPKENEAAHEKVK